MADAWEPGPSLEPGAIREGDFRSKPEPSGTSLKGTDVEEAVDTDLDSDLRELIDDFNRSPNVKRANALVKMLERPDSVLKELTLGDWRHVVNDEGMKCRLTVIEALSRSTKLVRLKIRMATEEEVLGLCKSLAANQSVKSFTLDFYYGVREEGAGSIGSMLAENSTLEELVLEGVRFHGNLNIEDLIGPLIGSDDGEPPRNTSLLTLTLQGLGWISREGEAAVARMLRTNKSLLSLRLPDCPHIEDVIRPLIGSDDGEPPRNTSLLTLSIQGLRWISTEEVAAVARMLRTNKSLLSLHLPNTFMASSPTDLIWKSLENNKTLQEFRIGTLFENRPTLEMVRLLVEHNFTLKTIWYRNRLYSAEDFLKKVLEERGIYPTMWQLPAIELPKTSDDLLAKHLAVKPSSKTTRPSHDTVSNRSWSSHDTTSNYSSGSSYSRDPQYTEYSGSQYSGGISEEREDFKPEDFKAHINLETSRRPVTEPFGIPPNLVTHYHVQPTSENISSPDSVPSHDIFLSYSEDGRDFAKQLYMNLRASNYNVLNDPDLSDSAEEELPTTLEQCQLAIVVLSEGYVTSKLSMQELSRFLKKKNTSDTTLKVIPLFYKVAVSDLDSRHVELKWAETWKELIRDGKVQEEEIGLWNETLKFIFNEKNAALERGKALLRDLILGRINAKDFCTQFSGACVVLELKNYCNFEDEYLLAVVKEIKKIIPPIIESKIDRMFGHLSMFELQSELSLQAMTSMLKEEPLLANHFLLQRAWNMGEYLQQKYIGCETFGVFDEHYDKVCTIAALFAKGFLYHFKVELLCGAFNKVSWKFDYKSCYPMLVKAGVAVANKWRIVCGHDYEAFYNTIEEGILEIENISEVSSKELEGSREGVFVLCLYNVNIIHLEYYFKNYQEMASIVGVGLEYAKAIFINQGEVKVEEILEEDWMNAWKEVESKPSSKWKLLRLDSCILNQEEQLILKDNISSKPLVWELAKYFILKKSIEIFSRSAKNVKYVTTSRDAHSQSHSSSGRSNNGSKLARGFLNLFGIWSTSNGNKDQDQENGEGGKDDGGDDKKGKSLENPGPSDAKDNDGDTTVKVLLLAGGDIVEIKDNLPPSTRELKFSILDRTIFPSLEFTFINRNSFKKIQSTVGYIQFTLGTVPEHGKETEWWSHTEMIIQFGIFGEEAQRKGELERDSLKHLDVEEEKQGNKTIMTTEKKGGREIGGKVTVSGKVHGVGLDAQGEVKSTKSDGISQQLESSHERSVNRSEGGFEITDHIDPTEHEIACTYRVPSRNPHLATTLQKCKLQCTWVALDVGDHGSAEAFVPYTFIASRTLQRNVSRSLEENVSKELKNEGKSWNPLKSKRKALNDKGTQQDLLIQCTQKYERVLYINHAMTHLDGKLHTIKERGGEPGNCTFFSSETSLTREYDWGNRPPLIKLPESETSSTVGASNDASTSSSGRQPQQI